MVAEEVWSPKSFSILIVEIMLVSLLYQGMLYELKTIISVYLSGKGLPAAGFTQKLTVNERKHHIQKKAIDP